jgi:hypothetical protein
MYFRFKSHISIRMFHHSRPSSPTQPYCGARRLWACRIQVVCWRPSPDPDSRLKLCIDVCNLYVKEIYLVERAFLRGNHFNAVSWIAELSTPSTKLNIWLNFYVTFFWLCSSVVTLSLLGALYHRIALFMPNIFGVNDHLRGELPSLWQLQ